MAYNFSQINGALKDNEEQNANIFNASGTEQGAQPAVGMQQGGEQAKTSTEGDIGGGGNAAASVGGEQANQTDAATQQTQAGRQASQKSTGKTATPGLFQRTTDAIQSASAQAQNEANAYTDKANKTDYHTSQGAFDEYLNKGTDSSRGELSGLINHAPVKADAFKPTPDMTFSDVDKLQYDEGILDVLKHSNGPEYNPGMAAFDLQSLHRTPGFGQIQEKLKADRDAAQTGYDKLKTETPVAAQAALDKNLGTAQGDLRSQLAAWEAKKRADESANASDWTTKHKASAADDARAAALSARDELAGQTDDAAGLDSYITGDLGLDPGAYSTGYTDATGDDFVTEDDAASFNRIRSLLGQGGEAVMAGKGGGQLGFNKKGYQDALMGKATERKGADDARAAAAKTSADSEADRQAKIESMKVALKGQSDRVAQVAAEAEAKKLQQDQMAQQAAQALNIPKPAYTTNPFPVAPSIPDNLPPAFWDALAAGGLSPEAYSAQAAAPYVQKAGDWAAKALPKIGSALTKKRRF